MKGSRFLAMAARRGISSLLSRSLSSSSSSGYGFSSLLLSQGQFLLLHINCLSDDLKETFTIGISFWLFPLKSNGFALRIV